MSRARVALVVAVVAAAALAFGVAVGGPLPPRRRAAPSPSPAPPAPAPSAASPAPAPDVARPPPTTPSGPLSAPPPPSCAREPEVVDPPGFRRPSALELLRLRVEELVARSPILLRDGSPELQEGLAALNGPAPASAAEVVRTAPDRVWEGFDVGVAAELLLTFRALGRRDLDAAAIHAERAREEAPEDAAALVAVGEVARRQGRSARAREAYREAFRQRPDEPALALQVAFLEAAIGELDRGVRAVETYLSAHPEDARTERWGRRLRVRRRLTAQHLRQERGGLVILHPRRLGDARVRELLDASARTMQEVAARLGRPRRAELAILVYDDRAGLREATCAPSWSGGLFDGVLHADARSLAGPRGLRTVRHESVHAQLSLLRGRVPYWFHEGLAQRFEGPPSSRTRAAWARLVERGFAIPFPSLEGALTVIDDPGDARLAYDQSLAMMTYLLNEGGDAALRDAAARIEAGEPEDLLMQVLPRRGTEAAFLAHLATVTGE